MHCALYHRVRRFCIHQIQQYVNDLVPSGTKDRSAPYGGGRDWAAMLPQGRLLTVHNAAHAPWIEAPSLVFDAIKLFLDGRWPEGAQQLHPTAAR